MTCGRGRGCLRLFRVDSELAEASADQVRDVTEACFDLVVIRLAALVPILILSAPLPTDFDVDVFRIASMETG